MQVEGIRAGDRYDELNGGWTATGDAVIDDGFAYVPIKYHDGREDTIVQPVGTQIPLSFGAGPQIGYLLGLSIHHRPEPDHGVMGFDFS